MKRRRRKRKTHRTYIHHLRTFTSIYLIDMYLLDFQDVIFIIWLSHRQPSHTHEKGLQMNDQQNIKFTCTNRTHKGIFKIHKNTCNFYFIVRFCFFLISGFFKYLCVRNDDTITYFSAETIEVTVMFFFLFLGNFMRMAKE